MPSPYKKINLLLTEYFQTKDLNLAWKQLLKIWHPDLNGGSKICEQITKAVNIAVEDGNTNFLNNLASLTSYVNSL